MSADSWFRRCFFAFTMPFFRLRRVFATPSACLRDRSGKALGLSNLRSDSPLDSVDVGRSYLDPIGVSSGSRTLKFAGCFVCCPRKWCRRTVVRYRLIRTSTDSRSHRALSSGMLGHSTFGQSNKHECRGPQLLTTVPMWVRKSSLFMERAGRFQSAWYGFA